MATRGCCVPTCNNSSKDGVSFYVIPKDVKLRKQWITSIARASKSRRWSPTGTSLKVCSAHFEGGRKTSDINVPTIFTMEKNDVALGPIPRKPSARVLAKTKRIQESVPVKRPPSPLVQNKKPPSPVPKQDVVKAVKETSVGTLPKNEKKAPAKPPRKKPAKKQRVRSQSASAKDEIKQEDGLISPVNMAPNVLARFIREDHLYCLPKSDSVSILQKLLEEKTRVVETLLERIHTLEMEMEEKDLKLNRLHEELERAQHLQPEAILLGGFRGFKP